MKFLIFNVIVVGALAYLFVKGPPDTVVTPAEPLNASEAVDQTRAAIEEVKKAAKKASRDIKNMISEKVNEIQEVQVNPENSENSTSSHSDSSVDTQIVPKEIVKRVVHEAPQYNAVKIPADQDRPDHGTANNSATSEEETKISFMTARERRRELNRLARDMELIFIEKLDR